MNTLPKKYMVDGQLLDEEQVKVTFHCGVADWNKLASRERIALRMAAVAAPNGRLLDIGCYAGMFLAELKSLYPNIDAWGVDYYEDNIAMARVLHPRLADLFRQMSAYALEFESESLDCVTLNEVIEHLHRPVDALREINRVLRVGGYLVLTTPNANAEAWRLIVPGLAGFVSFCRRSQKRKTPGHQIFFENVEWNRHLYAWTPSTLNTLLVSTGFGYVDYEFCCDTLMQKLFPRMGVGLAFLVRKVKTAPTNLV